MAELGMEQDPMTGVPQIFAETDPTKALEGYDLKEVEQDNQEKKLKLDGEEKKKLLDELCTIVKNWEDEQEDFYSWCEKIDDAYRGILPPRNEPWPGASNINTQIIKTKVRTMAQSGKSALDTNPIFPLEPREESDVERVRQIELFLDYAARNEMKVMELAYSLLLDTGKYGTSIVKTPFVVQTRDVTEVETYDGKNPEDMARFAERFPTAMEEYPEYVARLVSQEKILLNVSHEKEIYRGPLPERVKRTNFIPAPEYTDIEKMPGAFEKLELSWWDLVQGEKDDKYESDALDAIRKKYSEEKDATEYMRKQYDIYEGWYEWGPEGEDRERCMFTLSIDENVLLRAIKYPYVHGRSYFRNLEFMPDADKFDGEPLAGDLLHPQKLMNMLFNTAIDCDTANMPVYAHTSGSSTGKNWNREKWRPFKIFGMATGESMQQMSSGHNSSNSLQLMQYAQRFGDDVSRISEMWTGGESKMDPKAPAAKTQMLLEVSQQGMSEYMKSFRVGWNEMVYQICQLYSQYGTEGKEFRILNEDGLPALQKAPGDLRIRPDMQPQTGEITFDRSSRKESGFGLISMILESPMLQQHVPPEKILELYAAVIENWEGGLGKKARGIIPSQEAVMQREAQMKAMEQEAAAQTKLGELTMQIKQAQGMLQQLPPQQPMMPQQMPQQPQMMQ